MAIKTFYPKNRLSKLEEEMKLLRSFLIGLTGKDREGDYRPEFVKKVFKASQEKERSVFKDKVSFLSHLQR